jgi:hypothetical protein
MELFIRYEKQGHTSESTCVQNILNEDETSRLGLEYFDHVYRVSPKASKHKGDIMFWIAYWPIDMLWLVFHDLVIDFANTVYTAVSGSYQKIADRRFKAATDDFTKKTDGN